MGLAVGAETFSYEVGPERLRWKSRKDAALTIGFNQAPSTHQRVRRLSPLGSGPLAAGRGFLRERLTVDGRLHRVIDPVVDEDQLMDERSWYVSTLGDRVVLTLPPLEDGKGARYVHDMSTVEATEIAAALAEAA